MLRFALTTARSTISPSFLRILLLSRFEGKTSTRYVHGSAQCEAEGAPDKRSPSLKHPIKVLEEILDMKPDDMPGLPGWHESIASESEADVKADRAVPVTMSIQEMQSFSVRRVTSTYGGQEDTDIVSDKPELGKS